MPTLVAARYRLERIVGRGGMGEVWLAEDTLLGRQVAAKRIGARGASERDLRRSQQEARVTAMLDNEHVVRVFDLVVEDDEQWLVMELVESENLGQLVRRTGPLTPTTAARMIHQAAQALAAAHAAAIIHRDVKPSNLLVTATGHVKLGDFGIARLEGDVGVTRTGQLVGSPGYIAPEVATGRPATTASDMWSLGATLFHAVEGHPPYETEDGNVIGTLYRIVNDPPPVPARGGWVTPLVAGLMVHDPAQRWNAQQVTTYLGQALAQSPDEFDLPVLTTPAPAGAYDGTHTSTLPTVAPAPLSPRSEPRRDRARRAPRFATSTIVAAVLGLVALVLVVVIGVRIAGDSGGGSPSADPSGSPSASASPKVATAAGMQAFIEDYVPTAVADPAQGFQRLTPAFQQESKGLDGYRGFWGQIRSATVTNVQADASAMTVSYDVDYIYRNDAERTGTVRLQLTYENGAYLIAGETR